MTFRPIRIVGDPVLHTPCSPIDGITPGVKALVEDLIENVDMDRHAGLAANQIGVPLRTFSWNIEGETGYILSPVIAELSDDELQDGEEGCLSVPDLWFPTKHPLYARAEGADPDGRKKVVEGEGLMGRCIQYEVDHLDGHLHIDRLDWEIRKRTMGTMRDL